MTLSHHDVTLQINPSAYIQDSAHVTGDDHIGPDSSVWFNSVEPVTCAISESVLV